MGRRTAERARPRKLRRLAVSPMRSGSSAKLRLPLLFAVLLGAAYGTTAWLGGLDPLALRWLLAAFLTALGVLVVQAVRFLVLDVAFLRTQGHHAPALLHGVVAIALYFVLGLLVASGVFHYSLTSALATSAVASVVLGLALQETLGNFFAGVALQIEQPFRPGDVVRIGAVEGKIEGFNWRATTVRTTDDTRVVIPNGNVAREALEVFARDALNRRKLAVGAPYEVAPQRVIRLLREAVTSVPGVSDREPPQARLGSFDDSSVGYEILYWVEDAMRMEAIDAQIRERIWYVFARHGVSIPYPHQVEVPYEPVAPTEPVPDVGELRLAEVPLLASLTAEERRRLAERARTLVFGPGERVLAAGGAGGSMFVVLDGRVEVRVPRPEGGTVRVAEIGPGEVIGEMSLLTGEARSADVCALDEVEVLEVGKAAMGEVLAANAALAEALSRHIGARLNERSEAFARERAPAARAAAQASLLQRIRQFFDLG